MASISIPVCFLLVCLSLPVHVTNAKSWEVHNETCEYESVLMDSLNNNCSSLEKVARKLENDVHINIIDIKILHVQLNQKLSFTNLTSLVINGEPGVTTITCTSDNAGIVLSDISDTVTLNNLSLLSCGLQISHENVTYASALALLRCLNVELNNVAISNGTGLGLAILGHLGGEINILSSSFMNMRSQEVDKKDDNVTVSGGGVFVKLLSYEQPLCPMMFKFDGCKFVNNGVYFENQCNYVLANATMLINDNQREIGGVHVFIGSGLKNINFSFHNCDFLENWACLGSGLHVQVFGMNDRNTEQIHFEVYKSTFSRNGFYNSGFGGGANIVLDTDSDEANMSDVHFIFKDVNFTENKAAYGGGVYIYSTKQALFDTLDPNTVVFENCKFVNNSAFMGSAVILLPSVLFRMLIGRPIVPKFQSCHFLENLVHSDNSHDSEGTFGGASGLGTVYASLHTIRFEGYSHFCNNMGTPLYIVDGIGDFQKSSANFSNNVGIHGGAVALIGSSTMVVGPERYDFIDNRALFQGGALYVVFTDMSTSSCFIQYRDAENKVLLRDWKAVIHFKNNAASRITFGNTIYATSLHPCQVVDRGTEGKPVYKYVNITEIFLWRGQNITFNGKAGLNKATVTTDAAFLEGNDTLSLIPGKRTEHRIRTVDEFNQTLAPLFEVSLTQSYEILQQGVVTNTILLKGMPNTEEAVLLQTMFPRPIHFNLSVNFTNCPPGFKHNSSLQSCVCIAYENLQVGLQRCDSDQFSSYLSPGYWAGNINESHNINGKASSESKQAMSLCPFCTHSGIRLDESKFNSSLVCGSTREGIGCGVCSNNYTVHFNSQGFMCKPPRPVDCKLGWLFYILSELFPVTLGFIFVLVFNISFTSGTVNGFILYSQLLSSFRRDANGIIGDQSKAVKSLKAGYHIIYGFLNLNFFSNDHISYCIWKKATALDTFAFKYITVLYSMILIAAVIWTMNKCGGWCIGKCKCCRITAVKSSIVYGISTFIVICYSQCVNISLELIVPLTIYEEKGGNYVPSSRRVWLNGEIDYFSKQHWHCALPALFFLLTIGLLPPILLLSYPLVNKMLTIFHLEDLKLVNQISRVIPVISFKPLLDSFQGCFKDNFRFFAGLYFLYRWTFLLAYICTKNFTIYYPAVGIILIVMLTVHTICQPYVKRVHNVLDALLFANLMLINSLSFYNYHKTISHENNTDTITVIQLILIYLPMVVMVVHIMRVSYKSVRKYLYKCVFETSISNVVIPTRAVRLRELVLTVSGKNKNLDSNIECEFIHDRLIDEDVEHK